MKTLTSRCCCVGRKRIARLQCAFPQVYEALQRILLHAARNARMFGGEACKYRGARVRSAETTRRCYSAHKTDRITGNKHGEDLPVADLIVVCASALWQGRWGVGLGIFGSRAQKAGNYEMMDQNTRNYRPSVAKASAPQT